MFRKTFNVFHTRIARSTTIQNTRLDPINPMTLIVDFDHTIPDDYYLDENDIIYGAYLDREYVGEFKEKRIKIQVESLDVAYLLEIFAHPHPGYQFVRSRLEPGNKIRIRFRARDPNVKDITKHVIYWDAGTGTYQTKIMGEVDALSALSTGRYLKSGSLTNV